MYEKKISLMLPPLDPVITLLAIYPKEFMRNILKLMFTNGFGWKSQISAII